MWASSCRNPSKPERLCGRVRTIHRDLEDADFSPATDCEIARARFREAMQKHLTPEDRLDILRAADTRRKWSSLDDRRICTRCNKFITGRQIEIHRDQRGRFLLHCPTPDCVSTVEDWFYQGSAASPENPAMSGRSEFSFAF
jgi:hypothetical protein